MPGGRTLMPDMSWLSVVELNPMIGKRAKCNRGRTYKKKFLKLTNEV